MKDLLKIILQGLIRNRNSWKWVVATGILLRMAFLFFSGQFGNPEYWEYGHIADQLLAGRGYSYPFSNEKLEVLKDAWYPSALVPPGYVFFLLPFKSVPDLFLRNFLLFTTQIALSGLAMTFFFRYVRQKAGSELALISLVFQALTPDLIYAAVSVGPTVWFHFLLGLFLWANVALKPRPGLVVQILSAGLLVLMRSEVLLFFVFYVLWQMAKGQKVRAVTLLLGIAICASPWIFRNLSTFRKPILSANLGVNFYRGNNPGSIGDWPPAFNETVMEMRSKPKTFEPRFDAYAFGLASDWISANPDTWFARLPEKLARFWFIDWHDTRTWTPLYWIPWFLTFLSGIYGMSNPVYRKNFGSLLLLAGTYTLIVLVFFPQLRYLTLVKFFWMPFAAAGVIKWLSFSTKNEPVRL